MSKPLETLVRRAAVTVTAASAIVVTGAVPAMADVPEDWSDPAEVSWLFMLALIVGIPAVLGVIITVLTVLPSMLRGEGLRSETKEPAEWVGGPSEDAPLADQNSGETGGASARW